jgi:lipopolysaccharide transport system ATP-binding protein
MSSEPMVRVQGVSKLYATYERPSDRLQQMAANGLARVAPSGAARQRLRNWAAGRARMFYALQDVSLEVGRGETVGIIGRNGSGKSTLLQIIAGTLTPSAGSVSVSGRVAALLELGAGFNPEFTGRENAYLNAQLLGLTKAQVDERFADIAAFADIGDFIDQPVKVYSSGMFVRLAFAVVAHVDADVLIIDEALAVGDAFFTQKCMRFLRSFMKRGTVLFVSHDTASVKSLCNRAVWLEKGKVVSSGSPKEVCDLYLQAFYEERQGQSSRTRFRTNFVAEQVKAKQDQRLKYINESTLRNDLKLFDFQPDAPSFGSGGAQIHAVAFLDSNGQPLNWVVGGEEIILEVMVECLQDLDSPIVGFFIKDRLGQTLFGDNTYLSHRDRPLACRAGDMVVARFRFGMPILPKGDYSLNVAVATGTQEDHVQQHWIHDALVFKSESSSVCTGLVGIPMHSIELAVEHDATTLAGGPAPADGVHH